MRIAKGIRKLIATDRPVLYLLIGGYFLLTLLCFLMLLLPFSRNESLSLADSFLLSVSLVSTTGLVPVDFGETLTIFGQAVSLFFIQLGGIGYMALSSFIILGKKERVPMLSAKLLQFEFNLPKRYPLTSFVYAVFVFTVLIETLGAILLWVGFKQEGIAHPLWNAVFHSISAFCTAGFSLFSDSMSGFTHNPYIEYTILGLSLLGSIGFIVLLDFWLRLIGKKKRVTLTSKIILIATFGFITLGTVVIFFSDRHLISLGTEGLEYALFQVISAHTTVGFNSYEIGDLLGPSTFIILILMIIGASPAGTGGGIKTTSITAWNAVLIAILRRRKKITFLSRQIPASKIYLAVASGLFYILILAIGVWGVLILDGDVLSFEEILFESTSALSTVGLSTGITGELSGGGKIIISLLMFIGRLGVLTFGFALISEAPLLDKKIEVEDIAI